MNFHYKIQFVAVLRVAVERSSLLAQCDDVYLTFVLMIIHCLREHAVYRKSLLSFHHHGAVYLYRPDMVSGATGKHHLRAELIPSLLRVVGRQGRDPGVRSAFCKLLHDLELAIVRWLGGSLPILGRETRHFALQAAKERVIVESNLARATLFHRTVEFNIRFFDE